MNLTLRSPASPRNAGQSTLRGLFLVLAGALALAAGARPAHAVALSSVTVGPTTVTGGTSTTGTVTLDVNAPAGGTKVNLASNNTAAATVPASVTVPAGTKTTTFTVTTKPVKADTAVTLSGTYLTATKTTTVNVQAPVLFAVYFNHASPAVGGESFSGTVLISGPAPTGGIKVALASDNPNLTVPANVTVQPNVEHVVFPVKTKPVTADVDATVTCTYLDRERTKTITVASADLASLTTDLTNPIGRTNVTGTVTLNGPAAANITVALSSNNAAATVPASVQILAGATSATFPVTTKAVAADTPVILKATYAGVSVTKTINVQAPELNALFVSGPSEIIGGEMTSAVAQINGPAPAGGIVINLTSSSPNVTVPATVTVGGGKTTFTISVKSTPVATSTAVTLTAKQGAITRTDTLTVLPPSLIGVPLSTYFFEGGKIITGTVRINAKAPVGGVKVALTSSNPAATVPSPVNIPAGATQANFFIRTSPVTENTRIDITGTFNGTVTSTITLTPPAAGFTAPSGSDF